MSADIRCLHLAELAWAAGLFDGEGSTIARRESARPRYRQLEVTVPQSGRDGLPQVLSRFQKAVLGLGTFDPPNDESVHRWRARGFEDGQATIALLWRFLSRAKRAQATVALHTLIAQYGPSGCKARAGRSRIARSIHQHTNRCEVQADSRSLDLAWAAGFFDAEGWVGLCRGGSRPGLPRWQRIRASVSQHGSSTSSPVVLERFAEAVGLGTIERHGEADDYKWVVYGLSKVERLREALSPWLGDLKLHQFQVAVDTFRAQPRIRGDRERCKRGHVYSGRLERHPGVRNYCNACSRLRGRAKRAAAGIKPRPFKNPARRYNS